MLRLVVTRRRTEDKKDPLEKTGDNSLSNEVSNGVTFKLFSSILNKHGSSF